MSDPNSRLRQIRDHAGKKSLSVVIPDQPWTRRRCVCYVYEPKQEEPHYCSSMLEAIHVAQSAGTVGILLVDPASSRRPVELWFARPAIARHAASVVVPIDA